ncbi:MAG TPA: LCP family protein [Acidimicrobiales bacterium]|nr:LCP family protein [Acidimicrobiales bacterium]
MARDLDRRATAGVIGRSSRGTELLGSSSRLAPPVVAPGRSPVQAPGPGPGPTGRRPRKRRSTGQRVLRGAVVFLALVLVLVGGVYGYLRYRLGQIKSIQCTSCASVVGDAPYNVLLVGSDSRAGNTGAAAKAFGTASQVSGQRSDTIKIIHVDPASGAASVLSIPRDTYVALSGMPASSGLATDNKINSAFNNGPGPLVQTIEDTFGIPIAHFVIIDFDGVINLVNSVGGIKLDFHYPVRDNDNGNNNSGLAISQAGCQTLNGSMALALARSRYYQYEVSPGDWVYDPSSDLGRIQRQNVVIESVIDKAKSSFNPLTINSFIGSIVNDITVDTGMSSGTMLSLAERYHAFSGSSLNTYTLPTAGEYSGNAGDVEVVQEPAAQQMLTQFLGTQPGPVTTAPLDAGGSPISVPSTTTPGPSQGSSSPSASGPATSTTAPSTPPFDPTPC